MNEVQNYEISQPEEIVFIAATAGSEWFADELTTRLYDDPEIRAKFKAIQNIGASYKYDYGYKLALHNYIMSIPNDTGDSIDEDKIVEMFRESPEFKKYSAKFTAKYIGDLVDESITDTQHCAIMLSGVGMGAGYWGMMGPGRKPTQPRRVRAGVAKNWMHAKRLRQKYMMNTLCVPTAIENFVEEEVLENSTPDKLKAFKEIELQTAFTEAKAFLLAEPDTSTKEKQIAVMQTIKLMTYANNPQMLRRWMETPEHMWGELEKKKLQREEKTNDTKKKLK
ncbi:MAG: hypothetical protein FWF97_03815 [Alphaproteobacteria bacterium]|nr:hypothetical protein [Alphaproteobacteria bacterium]